MEEIRIDDKPLEEEMIRKMSIDMPSFIEKGEISRHYAKETINEAKIEKIEHYIRNKVDKPRVEIKKSKKNKKQIPIKNKLLAILGMVGIAATAITFKNTEHKIVDKVVEAGLFNNMDNYIVSSNSNGFIITNKVLGENIEVEDFNQILLEKGSKSGFSKAEVALAEKSVLGIEMSGVSDLEKVGTVVSEMITKDKDITQSEQMAQGGRSR